MTCPYSDVFPDFPGILRSRSRDQKTTKKRLSGLSRVQRFSDGLFVNSCMELGQLLGRYLIVNL